MEAARQLFSSLGGTLEHFYFAFAPDNLVVICDLPDNEAAAAFSLGPLVLERAVYRRMRAAVAAIIPPTSPTIAPATVAGNPISTAAMGAVGT